MSAIHTHLSLAILAAFSFQAALADTIEESESRRQEMRRRQQEQQLQREVDVRLDDTRQSTLTPSAAKSVESPCFPIHTVTLTGDAADRFQFALKKALKETGFQSGQCLGVQGINRIMVAAQNAVIGRGYTTTRILAAPQDLNSGTLELTVLPGKVRSVRTDTSHNDQTRAARIAAFQNEIPLKGGDILNLRRIEQGLENLKRVPTAEADIQIVPADTPDESDIIVAWRQRLLPYRLSLGVDDSGSKTTGKYQGSLTFSADNPFGLSDLFYLSYGRHLGHTDTRTDSEGKKTAGAPKATPFTIPFLRATGCGAGTATTTATTKPWRVSMKCTTTTTKAVAATSDLPACCTVMRGARAISASNCGRKKTKVLSMMPKSKYSVVKPPVGS